ncbi:MAG: 30S ribosomal protein S4 [Candidatus Micrarchaeia archaeon]
MGDPRKLRKKYEVPQQLWDSARIEEEGSMVEEYGLKNIREVWVAKSLLRKIRNEYKALLALGEAGNKPKQELLQRVIKAGYCKPTAVPDDILSLTTRDILERRLQTIVVRNGLAKSMRQARQLITHGYISVNGRKVRSPSYQVSVDMQSKVGYYKPINLDLTEKAEWKSQKPQAEAE